MSDAPDTRPAAARLQSAAGQDVLGDRDGVRRLMPADALALVLVAAVAHALWNFAARGVRADGGLFVFLYAVGSTLLWLPVTVVWLLLHPVRPDAAWLFGPAVSGMLHTVYGVVLQRGYRRGDLSLVYPVARGVGPLVTLVVAVAALGERPARLGIVGALVIVAGIGVISLPGRGTVDSGRRPVRAGIAWGAATGLTIAAYTIWDSHGVNALGVPPLPYFTISLLFQTLPLAPRAWRRRATLPGVLRAHRREVLAVAVLSPLAYVLVLQAMRLAPVALVASTRETSIVIGSLLGVTLLKEPDGGRRATGAVVVLAGIGCVALS
ncbi:MAG: DMT family transporter [Marmoricola sp.]